MHPRTPRIVLIGLVVVLGALAGAGCGEVPTPVPAGPLSTPVQAGIDYDRYAALKARVEALRSQGRDVSRLDSIIRDIEYWIAAGKVDEANLRITDLAGSLDTLDRDIVPTYPPEPTLPPAPAFPPAPQAGPEVLFQEDFAQDIALNAWQSRLLAPDPGNTGFWERRQEALYLHMSAGSTNWTGMVNVTGDNWKDYVYNVSIYPTGNLEVGAVFRYTDQGFYRFRFLSEEYTAIPTRLLERGEGDEIVALAQAEGPGYQVGRWYNVQIAAVGAQLMVYLDGEPILQATDSNFPSGRVGVYALSLGEVYFDNVWVTAAK